MTTPTTPQDAYHVPLSKVDRLRQDAAAASELRALTAHPDVIALRAETIRKQVDALIWAGIVLGLAFTMVNVQTFAAAGAGAWSLPWIAAWLLDPMVSLVLVAVLRAEQLTARYQVEPAGPWVRRTKLFAFAATYTMNTWEAWSALHPAGIVLHSVPPALVYLAAETGPTLRDRLTEAVLRAGKHTTATAPLTPLAARPAPDTQSQPQPAQRPAPRRQAGTGPARSRARSAATPPRKGLADFLAEARAAYAPGTVISPAWVRSVTDCRRTMSKNVADALKAEHAPALAAHLTSSPTTGITTNHMTNTAAKEVAA